MEVKEKTVINQSGEVLEHTKEVINYKKIQNQEPDFIKLYLADICYLADLKQAQNKFLNILIKFSYFEPVNKRLSIILNRPNKIRIQKILEYKNLRSIENLITELVKGKILYHDTEYGERTSAYYFNPYLFGKYEWKDIAKVRLTVDYDDINGKTFYSHFTTKTEMEKEDQEEKFARQLQN